MAPSVTNYAEIQNDEIEVLRSIYMDDFVEEKPKTGAWNVGLFAFTNFLKADFDHPNANTPFPLAVSSIFKDFQDTDFVESRDLPVTNLSLCLSPSNQL